MRISELLTWRVVDSTGRPAGPIHDVRVTHRSEEDTPDPTPLRIAGLVIGGGRLAHRLGFAEGRATGPWLLRMLTARSSRQARFLPADQVQSWGPGIIWMRGRAEDLPRLIDELRR